MPPHHTLILSFHLRLGCPSGLFHPCIHTKTLYKLLSPIRSIRPAHLILLDLITRTILGAEYRSFSFSLCSFLRSPVTPSVLGPNILYNTLFSNTLSLRSSLNVSDQVSHPYKTTGKNIVRNICYCLFCHHIGNISPLQTCVCETTERHNAIHNLREHRRIMVE